MIERIISGGQIGADLTAWKVAKEFGIPTAGYMPAGFMTEVGRRPQFAALYGAVEHSSPNYPARTEANVYWSDGTAIFTNDIRSPGTLCAANACKRHGKPTLTVSPTGVWNKPESLSRWIETHGIKILNVGGNRRSSFPQIDEWVGSYLSQALILLGHSRVNVEPMEVGS